MIEFDQSFFSAGMDPKLMVGLPLNDVVNGTSSRLMREYYSQTVDWNVGLACLRKPTDKVD